MSRGEGWREEGQKEGGRREGGRSTPRIIGLITPRSIFRPHSIWSLGCHCKVLDIGGGRAARE